MSKRVPLLWLSILVLAFAVACTESPETKKAKHLERGDSYFAEQKYKEATIEYRNVIQLDGGNPRALKGAALSYFELREPAQAFPLLIKARDVDPEDLEVRLKLATLYALARKLPEGKQEVNTILEKDPKNFDALLLLSELAVSTEELEDAMQRLKDVESDYRDRPKYHMALGALFVKKRDLLKAENAFMDALSGTSDVPEAHLALGDIHTIEKDPVQAEKEYKAAADLAPGASPAQLKLADFYLYTGKPEQARQVLEGIAAAAPDFFPASYRLAGLALDEKRIEDALKTLEPVFKKNPADYMGLKLRGHAFLMQRKTADALNDLGAAVKAHPEDVQAHYLLALACIQADDVGQAKAQLKEATEIDPYAVNAVLRLSELNIITGSSRAATDDLLRILEKAPKLYEALILLADAAVTPQEVTDAIRRLKENQADYQGKAMFHLALGSLYLKQGKLPEAEASFLETLSLEPAFIEGHVAMGRLFEAKKDPTRAEQEFKTAADLAPDNPRAKINLADFYLRQQKTDSARQILEKTTSESPDYLPALYRQANMVCRENRFDECLKLLEPVFGKNPVDPQGLFIRGRMFLAKGQNAEAAQDFQEILKQRPKASEPLYLLAMANLQAGDVVQAKANLQAALAVEANYTEAGMRLAEIYLREDNFQSVIDLVERLYQKQPRAAGVYSLLASAYLGKRDWAKAAEASGKLIEMNPTYPVGPYMLGVALREQGKRDEARKQFEEALKLAPGFYEALSELVALDMAEKKPDAALARVEEEVGRAPNAANLHFLLGNIYLARDERPEAEGEFVKSIELDPKQVQAYVALSRIYAASRQFDQALTKLDGALKAEPGNVSALMLSGIINQEIGNINQAQDAFERILTKNPDFPPAANNLAYIYSEHQGDLDKALRLAQKAREGAPQDPQIADTLGWILYKKGSYDWALTYLQESAAKLKNNAESQYHLGMTQYKLGDGPAAKQALDRALELNPKFAGAEEARKTLQEL